MWYRQVNPSAGLVLHKLGSNKPDFNGLQAYTQGASTSAMSALYQYSVHLRHRCHARPTRAGSNTMSKNQRPNKESKKQPLLTPKEKKAAKRDKKHTGGHVPFVVKDS